MCNTGLSKKILHYIISFYLHYVKQNIKKNSEYFGFFQKTLQKRAFGLYCNKNPPRRDTVSFTKHSKNGIIYYTSSLFDKHGIPHFFAAKHGGKSGGDFFSLNISTSRRDRHGNADSIGNVEKNLSLGLELLGSFPERACMMKQIHSADIERAEISCAKVFCGKGDFQPCDGIFAEKGDIADTLCVKTADCVPVLVYDVKNDVAMALHAGWRGTVGNICGKAVAKLNELHDDAQVIAAIGPCILDCCYEVNSLVYDAATKACELSDNAKEACILPSEIEKCFTKRYFADGEQKFRVSLSSLNKVFLESAGVPSENIDSAELCTCCHRDGGEEIFFSHRASGGFSGTQMSVVKLKN